MLDPIYATTWSPKNLKKLYRKDKKEILNSLSDKTNDPKLMVELGIKSIDYNGIIEKHRQIIGTHLRDHDFYVSPKEIQCVTSHIIAEDAIDFAKYYHNLYQSTIYKDELKSFEEEYDIAQIKERAQQIEQEEALKAERIKEEERQRQEEKERLELEQNKEEEKEITKDNISKNNIQSKEIIREM